MAKLLILVFFLVTLFVAAQAGNYYVPAGLNPADKKTKPQLQAPAAAPVPKKTAPTQNLKTTEYVPPKSGSLKDDPKIKKSLAFRGRTVTQSISGSINVPGPSQPAKDYEKSRNYVFAADGMFMVNVTFANSGKLSNDTGNRTYFLLPVTKQPTFKTNGMSGDLQVETASGQTLVISNETGSLKNMGGPTIKEDPALSASNKGGVEIENFFGIVLDAGWAQGTANYLKGNRKSNFKDQHGKSCEVTNSEIFNYPKTEKENVSLKYQTRDQLKPFLEKRCPELDLTPLKGAEAVKAATGNKDKPAQPGK